MQFTGQSTREERTTQTENYIEYSWVLNKILISHFRNVAKY